MESVEAGPRYLAYLGEAMVRANSAYIDARSVRRSLRLPIPLRRWHRRLPMEGKEGDVIHGLKLAFTGDEIIRSLDGRLDVCRAEIQLRRDEIDGKIEHPSICQWQEPVESVQAEILEIEQLVRTLTMFR